MSHRRDRITKTFAGSGMVKDNTLFQHLPERPKASLHDPPPPLLRAYIADQLCWWCGKGPFKVLAGHTSQAHGINRIELRNLAGLFQSTVVCSEEFHDGRIKILKARGNEETFKSSPGKYHKRNLQPPAAAANRAKLQKLRESLGPEGIHRQVVEAGRKAGMVNRLKAAAYREPHVCTNLKCNNIIPVFVNGRVTNRLTCSSKCYRQIRSRNAKRASVTRMGFRRRELCGITGCEGKYLARGLCSKHYQAYKGERGCY